MTIEKIKTEATPIIVGLVYGIFFLVILVLWIYAIFNALV